MFVFFFSTQTASIFFPDFHEPHSRLWSQLFIYGLFSQWRPFHICTTLYVQIAVNINIIFVRMLSKPDENECIWISQVEEMHYSYKSREIHNNNNTQKKNTHIHCVIELMSHNCVIICSLSKEFRESAKRGWTWTSKNT